MASKEVLNIRTIKSRLSHKSLVDILKKYYIDPEFRSCLPEPGNTIVYTPGRFCWGISSIFKYGLRLPTFHFLEVILGYYHLYIA